jgi:hypothetical protein
VRDLSETTTLISVEVDVINIEGSVLEVGVDHSGDGGLTVGTNNVAVGSTVELKVDDDLVVLEGDEGKSKTGVAAEEELEGNVESGLGLLNGGSISITSLNGGKSVGVTNHGVVTVLKTSGEGKLVPDLEPVTVVHINALTTNLELNGVDEVMAEGINPAERGTRDGDRGNVNLEVHTVDEITVTGDSAGNTLAEVSGTVEGLLDRLHGEVSVASVDHLEESNLRIACTLFLYLIFQ